MNPHTKSSRLVAIDKVGSKLLLLDVEDGTIIPLPAPLSPHEMLLSVDRRTLWTSIYGSGTFRENPAPGNQIAEVDLEAWKIRRLLDISPYTSPHGLTMDDSGVLWTSCDPHGVVLAISPASGAVLDAVETGTLGSHWVLATPDGTKLFTSNKEERFLTVIDPKARRATAKLALPHGSEGLGFSLDGRWLFVADRGRPDVLKIDVQREVLADTIALHDIQWDGSRISHHMRLRCSPDGAVLAVSAYHSDRLVLIDCNDTSRQTTVKTGRGPMALAFDPRKQHHLYLSNHDEGTLSLFDLEAMRFLRTFPFGDGVESMEFV